MTLLNNYSDTNVSWSAEVPEEGQEALRLLMFGV